MGGIVSGITDAIGLTDSGAGERAARESAQTSADGIRDAALIDTAFQREALEYLKEQERLPAEYRERSLKDLYSRKGDAPSSVASQQELVGLAESSPLYAAIMSSQNEGEEAILRNSAATGGLRSGNVNDALYEFNSDLKNKALLDSYNVEYARAADDYSRDFNAFNAETNILSGLANLNSLAPQIANQTSAVGASQANGVRGASNAISQGQIAGAQSRIAGQNQIFGDATQVVGGLLTGFDIGGFSDVSLKKNIKYIGEENGHKVYTWEWNEDAKEFGLVGEGRGVIADEVEQYAPEAVTEKGGKKQVNYKDIGVAHA